MKPSKFENIIITCLLGLRDENRIDQEDVKLIGDCIKQRIRIKERKGVSNVGVVEPEKVFN